MVELICISL